MAKRGRASRKSRAAATTIAAADFQYPGEAKLYWQGVASVLIIFTWLAVMLVLYVKTAAGTRRWDLGIECLAWPLVSIAICNILSARPRQKQFRKRDQQSRVMSTNYPEIYKALQEFAQMTGLKHAPDMYLLAEQHALMFSMPVKGGTIVASVALKEQLSPDEFRALIAHEMGHILARHMRTELAIIFVSGVNPIIKIALLPVTLMSLMMRGWLDAIDYSADRCAYVLTRGAGRLVNAAIVKQACAVVGPSGGISLDELDRFLSSTRDVSTDQGLLEVQLRAGRFLNSVPNLRDRVESLQEFPKTEQARAALEKVAKITGGPVAM